MSAKRIRIETEKRRKFRYKFEDSGRIYAVTDGVFSESLKKIGEADSLDDAIQIIKTTLDDTVRDVCVENW